MKWLNILLIAVSTQLLLALGYAGGSKTSGDKIDAVTITNIIASLYKTRIADMSCIKSPCKGNFTIPLQTAPYWTSQWHGGILGVALADINNDGYPEVITIHEDESNYLYANKSGIVDITPSWQSNDVSGHVTPAIGDYDNDGDLDMACACYYFSGGRARLYRNDNGTLTRDPVWIASSGGGTWGDWGDIDNDGDLDYAIADMFAYPMAYRNNNGVLEDPPVWQGTDYNLDFGGAWIDVDNDGDVDLAVSGINPGVPLLRIYYNRNGTLETVASWKSQRMADVAAVGLSVGDLDKDGWLDVGVSCGFTDPRPNFVFRNLHDSLESNPSWTSNDASSSGASLFGDLNSDGYLDWAVNNGNAGVCYENNNGTLNRDYTWNSTVGGGLGIDLGDIDLDGIRYKEDTITAPGNKKLFYLSIILIQKLIGITINANPVPISDYCYNLKSGWVSFKNSIGQGARIILKYNYSIDRELLLSDATNGLAYLFKNTTVDVVEHYSRPLNVELKVYPNPVLAGKATTLSYTLKHPAMVEAEVYDCAGNKLAKLFSRMENAGSHREKLSLQFPSGVYFLRLKFGENYVAEKINVITRAP